MKKLAIAVAAVMLLIPIGLVCFLSSAEKKQWEPQRQYNFSEMAYGELKQVARITINENFEADGKYVSRSYEFAELPAEASACRVLVSVGDEVNKGQPIATAGGEELPSPVNGIVSEINTSSERPYIRLQNIDELLFECGVPDRVKLKLGGVFTDAEGDELTCEWISNTSDGGSRKALFRSTAKKAMFGQALSTTVFTGAVYDGVLAVSSDCVYQKQEGGAYYIRHVGSDGSVIGECEVNASITYDGYTAITGAEEGWFCDSGYKYLFG